MSNIENETKVIRDLVANEPKEWKSRSVQLLADLIRHSDPDTLRFFLLEVAKRNLQHDDKKSFLSNIAAAEVAADQGL